MINDDLPDLPKGINAITRLPNSNLGALWESIIVDPDTKAKLLAQAVLNFSARPKIDRTTLPLHGVILLAGAPGTGKTSLAKGLASELATNFKNGNFRLIEVEPHGLTSSAMGKTQRAVAQLFSQTIAELAADGPAIVLLDEVETLAVDRSKLSLEANPVDIHRATDAVLVQLDQLAETHKHLLFVATSNFPQAIDSAFLSRCDLVMEIPLPDAAACEKILRSCLAGLAETYPDIAELALSSNFPKAAREFVGLDGRAIRKAVAAALASNPATAANPGSVTLDQLKQAAISAKNAMTRKEAV